MPCRRWRKLELNSLSSRKKKYFSLKQSGTNLFSKAQKQTQRWSYEQLCLLNTFALVPVWRARNVFCFGGLSKQVVCHHLPLPPQLPFQWQQSEMSLSNRKWPCVQDWRVELLWVGKSLWGCKLHAQASGAFDKILYSWAWGAPALPPQTLSWRELDWLGVRRGSSVSSPSEHTDWLWASVFRPGRDNEKRWTVRETSWKFVLFHFEHLEGSAETQCICIVYISTLISKRFNYVKCSHKASGLVEWWCSG